MEKTQHHRGAERVGIPGTGLESPRGDKEVPVGCGLRLGTVGGDAGTAASLAGDAYQAAEPHGRAVCRLGRLVKSEGSR